MAKTFLSTPSARRATEHEKIRKSMTEFLSTPSARRATILNSGTLIKVHYFYPRPPRGGRPFRPVEVFVGNGISIHALREEGDVV